MRTIWKGSISFGIFSIPISLFPATHREEMFEKIEKKTSQPFQPA
jgi:non-homologous end joining protein Ku